MGGKMPKRLGKRRDSSYPVGYGRPPEETRFKPGQSGNPKGRPKGSKNKLAMFAKALGQRIYIEERGKRRSITILDAIFRTIMNRALKGDLKAAEFIFNLEPEITRYVETRPRRISFRGMSREQAAAEAYFRLVRA